MSKNVYIMKELIDDVEYSELDFNLHNQFDFDYEVHDDFITLNKGQGQASGCPIDLDILIGALNRLKTNGATHVEMNYHEDHIGYEISGYRIKLADPALVEAYETSRKQAIANRAEIMELKKRLIELENPGTQSSNEECNDDLPF